MVHSAETKRDRPLGICRSLYALPMYVSTIDDIRYEGDTANPGLVLFRFRFPLNSYHHNQ